jgi:hypothetical protein
MNGHENQNFGVLKSCIEEHEISAKAFKEFPNKNCMNRSEENVLNTQWKSAL